MASGQLDWDREQRIENFINWLEGPEKYHDRETLRRHAERLLENEKKNDNKNRLYWDVMENRVEFVESVGPKEQAVTTYETGENGEVIKKTVRYERKEDQNNSE